MRAEAQAHVDQIEAALALLRRFLDWDRALQRLDELNAQVEDPTLWNDPKAAQEVMRERRRLDEAIGATRAIEQRARRHGRADRDGRGRGRRGDGRRRASPRSTSSPRAPRRDKVAALLAGEADANDTYIEVNAGAGGTESQDWAEMLQRMYTRWAERHGYEGRADRPSRRRAGRDQVGDAAGQGRERLWLCQDRERRPPAGPDQPL